MTDELFWELCNAHDVVKQNKETYQTEWAKVVEKEGVTVKEFDKELGKRMLMKLARMENNKQEGMSSIAYEYFSERYDEFLREFRAETAQAQLDGKMKERGEHLWKKLQEANDKLNALLEANGYTNNDYIDALFGKLAR